MSKKLITIALVGASMFGAVAPAAQAGRTPCPGWTVGRVEAYDTDTYEITFRGRERAIIRVSGDFDTDLDLEVLDSMGRRIACDMRLGDQCEVSFVPAWTDTFEVRIINRGGVYNDYVMETN